MTAEGINSEGIKDRFIKVVTFELDLEAEGKTIIIGKLLNPSYPVVR